MKTVDEYERELRAKHAYLRYWPEEYRTAVFVVYYGIQVAVPLVGAAAAFELAVSGHLASVAILVATALCARFVVSRVRL